MKLKKLIKRLNFDYVSEKITEANFSVQKEDKKKISPDLFLFVFFFLCIITLYIKLNFNLFSFCVLLLSLFGVIFIFLRDNRKEYKLFQFDGLISSENVITEMNKVDCRPATLRELLRWALKNWNGIDFVIALGQSRIDSGDARRIPVLKSCKLYLLWFQGIWESNPCFLAVKK